MVEKSRLFVCFAILKVDFFKLKSGKGAQDRRRSSRHLTPMATPVTVPSLETCRFL